MPLRRVDIPVAVTSFANGVSGADEPARLSRARLRVSAALGEQPRLYLCSGAANLLVPPGSTAWTLGRLVLMRAEAWGTDRTDRLVAHELVHVAQWREQGVAGFLRDYLSAYWASRRRGLGHWGAYREIPAEVEAYDLEEAASAEL